MKTKVIFRKWKGEIIAIFPELPGDMELFTCMSYMHIGQHSACRPFYIIKESKPTTPFEYAALKNELENYVGYDLQIIKRMHPSHIIERKKHYDQYRKKLA